MSVPTIRYPLPSLLLAAFLGALAWRGSSFLARTWSKAIVSARRSAFGQEYPASDRPMSVDDVLVKKVLLLQAPLDATKKPGGAKAETLRRRSLALVYDMWPDSAAPAYFRIGTAERAIGWVGRDVAMPWDTRLVVRPTASLLRLSDLPTSAPGNGVPILKDVPLPVLSWNANAVEVAVWARDRPWSKIDRRGWLKIDAIAPSSLGVLLTQEELSDALRRALDPKTNPPIAPKAERLQSVLGLPIGDPLLSPESVETARADLPAFVFGDATIGVADRPALLAKINERSTPDASWDSTRLWFVPLNALP